MARPRPAFLRIVTAVTSSVLALQLAFLAVAAQVPPPAADASAPDGIYTPYTNRDIYQRIASDYQEIAGLTDRVLSGSPLPTDEILTIYEEAKIARVGEQARQLRGFAREAARVDEFPDSAAFFGSTTFLDDPVIDAINGTRSAANYSPLQRRAAIQKGVLRIVYHWSARYVVQGGQTLNPGLVDEAWAIYMGLPVNGSYPHSVSATAVALEAAYNRAGAVDPVLRRALSQAQIAAGNKDAAAYDAAARQVFSRFNAIFYLGTAWNLNEPLRSVAQGDAATAAAQLTEGLGYYRSIQPTVASADPDANDTLVAYFNASPDTLTTAQRDAALSALNRAFDALLLEPADMVTPATFQ
jgi:hypothetical protein